MRKATLVMVAAVMAAATVLAGCPDNNSKPANPDPASASAKPTTTASAPAASASAKSGGSGW